MLKNYGLTEKYRAENIKHWVENGYVQPSEAGKVVLASINSLADAEVIGAEVYKSTNGGTTWAKTNQNFIDDLFSSYGYYFAAISVDPSNSDKIYEAKVWREKTNIRLENDALAIKNLKNLIKDNKLNKQVF